MKKELTDSEIFAALGDDGDNMLSEFKLADARKIEALVRHKTNIVWIPNTGAMPKCKTVLVKFNGGFFGSVVDPDFYEWSQFIEDPIKEYAIIEE